MPDEETNVAVDVAETAPEEASLEGVSPADPDEPTFDEPVEEQPAGDEPAGADPADADADAEAEAGAEAEPETEPQDWLFPELAEAGRQLGMTAIQMRQFGSAGKLQDAIIEEVRARERNATQQPETKPEEAFDLGINEDDFDPGVVKALRRVHDHHAGRSKQMESALVGLSEMVQQGFERMMDSQLDSWLDGRLASLGDEYEDVFGTGGVDEIDRSSKQYENRVTLRNEIKDRIARGRDASQSQSFKVALRAHFGDRAESAARRKLASQVKKRSSQTISRPTARRVSSNATPEQRALATAKRKIDELGLRDE